MEKFDKFWFEGTEHKIEGDNLLIELKYSLDKKVFFTEKLSMPVTFSGRMGVVGPAFEKALKALHMVGGISYYKAYLPAEMAGLELSGEQAEFWKKVYERGLGEFFFKNKIDFRGLIKFPSGKSEETAVNLNGHGSLVAIGGGKDSIVTAEIMKAAQADFELFSLRDSEPIRQTAEIVGKSRLIVSRQIDAQLFELNEKGALNGHVPITAYISCLMTLCAVYYGYAEVIMSLEKSSNFGQFDYLGMDINHQYSKSEEFEKDFREYLGRCLGGIEYFSLLRKFDELKICQILTRLSNFDQYAPLFASCNRNFKINGEKPATKWCGECPKCAFVYLCLAAFLPRSRMVEIFGQDLLDKADLQDLFAEILGEKNFKPFECVGTPEESWGALYLIAKKGEYNDSLLVKTYAEKALTKTALAEESLKIKTGGFLTEKWEKVIAKYA